MRAAVGVAADLRKRIVLLDLVGRRVGIAGGGAIGRHVFLDRMRRHMRQLPLAALGTEARIIAAAQI